MLVLKFNSYLLFPGGMSEIEMASVEVIAADVPTSSYTESLLTNVVLSPVNNPQLEEVFLQVMKANGDLPTSSITRDVLNYSDSSPVIVDNKSPGQNTFFQLMMENGKFVLSPVQYVTGNNTVQYVTGNNTQNSDGLDQTTVNNQQMVQPILQGNTQNETTEKVPLKQNATENVQILNVTIANNQPLGQSLLQDLIPTEILQTAIIPNPQIEDDQNCDLSQSKSQQIEQIPILQDLTNVFKQNQIEDNQNFGLAENGQEFLQDVATNEMLEMSQNNQNQTQTDQNLNLTPSNKEPLEHALFQVVTENESLVTPLIKQDLRNKIKLRRESQGLGAIKIEFTTPPEYKVHSILICSSFIVCI